MSIWSKLFGNPMKPLSDAIIKAIRQDAFGVQSYMNWSSGSEDISYSIVCQLEFFYFYLSCVKRIAQSKLDARKLSKFNSRLNSTLMPQVIDTILGTLPVFPTSMRRDFESLRRDTINRVDSGVQYYSEQQDAQTSIDPHEFTLPLDSLAKMIAVRSGNISLAEFEEGLFNIEFNEGVKNLVSYNLSRMDLDALIEAAVKSI
jgi:hypothetical protein